MKRCGTYISDKQRKQILLFFFYQRTEFRYKDATSSVFLVLEIFCEFKSFLLESINKISVIDTKYFVLSQIIIVEIFTVNIR